MLALSRKLGESIFVRDPAGDCVITVLQIRESEVSLSVVYAAVGKPGQLTAGTTKISRDNVSLIAKNVEVALINVNNDKARLGVNVPASANVFRWEVWNAIRRDDDDGFSASRAPRPSGPQPPPLDVRLPEPPPADENGE